MSRGNVVESGDFVSRAMVDKWLIVQGGRDAGGYVLTVAVEAGEERAFRFATREQLDDARDAVLGSFDDPEGGDGYQPLFRSSVPREGIERSDLDEVTAALYRMSARALRRAGSSGAAATRSA